MRTDAFSYPLLANGSATGAAVQVRGGRYFFMAEGTPVGATCSLQIQLPSGNWCDVGAGAGATGTIVKSTTLPFTVVPIDIPPGFVRLALTGGTPSGVNAWLVGIG